MERNNNPQTVTMAVEVYQNLLGMADRSKYTTVKIERHVRKMNPHLQAAHQAEVLAVQERRSARIRKCRDLIVEAHGKTVYAVTFVNYSSEKLADLVFTPMHVMCINHKNRDRLDLYPEHAARLKYNVSATVTPNNVHLELPADYIQINTGPYRNLWVKKYSPIHWHSIEEQARLMIMTVMN